MSVAGCYPGGLRFGFKIPPRFYLDVIAVCFFGMARLRRSLQIHPLLALSKAWFLKSSKDACSCDFFYYCVYFNQLTIKICLSSIQFYT